MKIKNNEEQLLDKKINEEKIGYNEYKNFKKKKKNKPEEAILAMCYYCNNGYKDGIEDCLIDNCPLYYFMPYHGKKIE